MNYYAVRDFIPVNSRTYLPLIKGERVEVICNPGGGFFSCCKGGKDGLVPSYYLQQQELNEHPQRVGIFLEDEWVFTVEGKIYKHYIPVDAEGRYVGVSESEN
ncbi:MAG: hypothetical protein EZS28_030302 [Streblomastix strix]|uniref:SH3 domain-containing protein n=1 Tax=Streblomastix strix TaxID=222440 RepID=A0A5J4UVK6_9EUKA|nr:MAG: hypothetical protein EZS28_030302 [Streblomastix strix]